MGTQQKVDSAPQNRVSRWSTRLVLSVTVFMLTVSIVTLIFWPRMIFTVRSGEAAILFRRFTGTVMSKVYGEGLHVIFPWDIFSIYDVKLQSVERDFRLLTNTGLPIDLKVVIRYRADLRTLPMLHTTVGPDYREKVVIPGTESVLRRLVGQYDPEEIYTNKFGLLQTITLNSLSESENRYVLIDDVLIKAVTLPLPVQEAIENKLILQQQEKAYVYRLGIEQSEAERRRVEARGVRDANRTVHESLTPDVLRWQGIQATRELASSPNAKTVIVGAGSEGLPLILGSDR